MPYFLMLLMLVIASPVESMNREQVVLLHGLARTSLSMEDLATILAREGYQVWNIDYPSRKYPIPELAKIVREEVSLKTAGAESIHFITHSLGGIVLRYLQKHDPLPNIGRVVMLSPPNQGSEVVDVLRDTWPFEFINGPAGRQLGTDAKSTPRSLGRVNFETGVITGDRSINWINSLIIPGDDDGKVSVERARVEGMVDFHVVHVSHPFIMKDKNVIANCLHFLREGRFDTDLPERPPP